MGGGGWGGGKGYSTRCGNTGPMIEKSRVQVPAGAAGKLCFPESTFWPDSSVSVPPPCYSSST